MNILRNAFPIKHQIIAYIYVTYIKESLHFSWGLALFLLHLPKLRLFYLESEILSGQMKDKARQRKCSFFNWYWYEDRHSTFLFSSFAPLFCLSVFSFFFRVKQLNNDRPGESATSRRASYPLSMFVFSVVFEIQQKKKKCEWRYNN